MASEPILPNLAEVNARPVDRAEVYYLLERFASLTVWDALNLEPASAKVLIQLEGASPHFNVYDRGSCLVMAPKDLYSEKRSLQDAIDTASAITTEVYNRGWVIEMAGFDKLQMAVWVKAQHLEDEKGKKLEILHYDPPFRGLMIYRDQATRFAMNKFENR